MKLPRRSPVGSHPSLSRAAPGGYDAEMSRRLQFRIPAVLAFVAAVGGICALGRRLEVEPGGIILVFAIVGACCLVIGFHSVLRRKGP